MRLSIDKALPLIELWYAALREPIGIKVQTNDAERMKTSLYLARKQAEEPELAKLMIQTSPLNPKGEVFITHREIDLPESEGLPNVEG
jgi:hypothetical protein